MKVQSLSTGEVTEEVLPSQGQDKTPCLADQAKARGWQAGIFFFGEKLESQGAHHFNPSIVERSDGLWLIVRRAVFDGYDAFGMNSLWAAKLSEEDGHIKPLYMDKLVFPNAKHDEHFEDPRVVMINGKAWVAACNFLWHGDGNWSGAHQTLGVFSCEPDNEASDWKCVQRYAPEIGGNEVQVDKTGARNEKNWLWWMQGEKLTVLYYSNPWRIAQFGKGWDDVTPHEIDPGPTWAYGDIRGGTPPVLVDDLYWTFFHSSLPWVSRFRRYYMGAIAFDKDPPFTPRYITPEPLLTGSQLDPWAPKKPLVVFPCGALLRKGEWLITYGVNDLKSGWTRIPHADIISLSKPILAPGANLSEILSPQPTISKGGDNHGKRKTAKARSRSAAIARVGEDASNNDAESVPAASAPPSPAVPTRAEIQGPYAKTLGDDIRELVAALETLAGGKPSRKTRILNELRRKKLAPRK